MNFAGVTDVYSSREDAGYGGGGGHGGGYAFMALNKNTGEAQCWGEVSRGGDCSGMNFAGVTDVYITGYAIMALNKNTGEAQCWGDGSNGGDCSGMNFAGVTDVGA